MSTLEERRAKRMAWVDSLNQEQRKIVNDYGLRVVVTLIQNGVRAPHRIKHIVETVLDEFSPTRGTQSYQGKKGDPWETEDASQLD